MGIEPMFSPLQGGILPLNERDICDKGENDDLEIARTIVYRPLRDSKQSLIM